MDSNLSEKMEMYLKSIYQLIEISGAAKANEIAAQMQVRMATVTSALQKLAEKELIHYQPYSSITLTDAGLKIAQDIIRKSSIIQDFFTDILEMNEEQARRDACFMEHFISEEALKRFEGFISFYKRCPHEDKKWREELGYICARARESGNCETCSKHSLNI
jgi:DtxR family Mn-dependent transcriptional regulator